MKFLKQFLKNRIKHIVSNILRHLLQVTLYYDNVIMHFEKVFSMNMCVGVSLEYMYVHKYLIDLLYLKYKFSKKLQFQ